MLLSTPLMEGTVPSTVRLITRAFTTENTFLLPTSMDRRFETTELGSMEALRESHLTNGQFVVVGSLSDPAEVPGAGATVALRAGPVAPGTIGTLVDTAAFGLQGDRGIAAGRPVCRVRILATEPQAPGVPATVTCVALPDHSLDLAHAPTLAATATAFGQITREYRGICSALADLGSEPPVDPDLFEQIDPMTAAPQIDTLLALLPLTAADQCAVLEQVELLPRLAAVVEVLTRVRLRLETSATIRQRTQKSLEERQRTVILEETKRSVDEELKALQPDSGIGGDYRAKIAAAKMPDVAREKALEEVARLETLPPVSPEVSWIRNHLDWMVALPWDTEAPALPALVDLREQLDRDHYGMDKVKEAIIDFQATRIHAPDSVRNPILCFVGPPGTGKTSIARSIATGLGRAYHRIALGGVRDESEVRGHRSTYIGAMPGRIIQALKAVKTSYPVVVLDEVDKLEKGGFSGDPASALLEVLDPEQNREFTDHYIGVPFDLSRVMFVCTANDLSRIPEALRDRMHIVQVTGYTEPEKIRIAEGHLIPKLLTEHRLDPDRFQPSADTLSAIIRGYTHEAGVRELERQLKRLIAKVIRAEQEGVTGVTVDRDFVRKHLGPPSDRREPVATEPQLGSATGLFYSERGGGTLPVQVSLVPTVGQKPEVESTGMLGETMRESVRVARTYLLANAKALNITPETLGQSIHVHFPAGATPKDGPSAGLAITAALRSAFEGRRIRQDIGITGEIDARGKALPIGGLAQKLYGAKQAGCLMVVIPKDNEADLEEVPAAIKEGLDIRPVTHFDEVWRLLIAPVALGSADATDAVLPQAA